MRNQFAQTFKMSHTCVCFLPGLSTTTPFVEWFSVVRPKIKLFFILLPVLHTLDLCWIAWQIWAWYDELHWSYRLPNCSTPLSNATHFSWFLSFFGMILKAAYICRRIPCDYRLGLTCRTQMCSKLKELISIMKFLMINNDNLATLAPSQSMFSKLIW